MQTSFESVVRCKMDEEIFMELYPGATIEKIESGFQIRRSGLGVTFEVPEYYPLVGPKRIIDAHVDYAIRPMASCFDLLEPITDDAERIIDNLRQPFNPRPLKLGYLFGRLREGKGKRYFTVDDPCGNDLYRENGELDADLLLAASWDPQSWLLSPLEDWIQQMNDYDRDRETELITAEEADELLVSHVIGCPRPAPFTRLSGQLEPSLQHDKALSSLVYMLTGTFSGAQSTGTGYWVVRDALPLPNTSFEWLYRNYRLRVRQKLDWDGRCLRSWKQAGWVKTPDNTIWALPGEESASDDD